MNRGWGGGLLFVFRGDGSRAQKLENRWNCLYSFVQGCSMYLSKSLLTCPKTNMRWAGLITVLLLFEFPKNFTCSKAMLRREFTSLTSISTSPGYQTLLPLHAGFSAYPGPSGSQNIWWNGNVLLKSLLISFSHSEWLCKSDCKTKMNMTFRERFKKKGKGKGDLSPKQSLLCLGTVGLRVLVYLLGLLTLLGPVVWRPIDTNPGFLFLLFKSFFWEKNSLFLFRASNHQIVNKKN